MAKEFKLGIKLNAQQKRAIQALQGASCVIAGAGTGKTTVLTAKIMYTQASDPCSNALALTFSRKAVAELQQRLSDCWGNVTVCTFHSFYFRMLRANGFRQFQFVENDAVKHAFLLKAIEKCGYSKEITVKELNDAIGTCRINNDNMLKDAAEAYFDILKAKKLMCYDALQYFAKELLEAKPAVKRYIRECWDYVLIDEAQDMNTLQAEIVKMVWSNDSAPNITFVGDPKQCIYGFRGSNALMMKELADHYAAPIYKLTTNYRSTAEILDVANELIHAKNKLVAHKGYCKAVPTFYAGENPKDEAAYVVKAISKLHSEGVPYKDIAVLFRSNSASMEVWEELAKKAIPFVKLGSDGLRWQNSKVKKLVSMLMLLHVRNTPVAGCCMPVFGVPTAAIKGNNWQSIIKDTSIPKASRKKLQQFLAIDPSQYTLTSLVIKLWEDYLAEYFEATDTELLDEFLNLIEPFGTWNILYAHLLKVHKVNKRMKVLMSNPKADYVQLMSIHTAKGAEFEHVFVVGAADGVMPDTSHDKQDMGEECRLAYVAVTRARQTLTISYPAENGGYANKPSRFFAEYFSDPS